MSGGGYFGKEDAEFFLRQFPSLSRDLIMSVAQQCEYNIQNTAFALYDMMKNPSELQYDFKESRIIEIIKGGWKIIILMRGLPGSGKTYLANKIFKASEIAYSPDQFILSTDDFFNRNGRYNYDIKKLEHAHEWNQKRCYKLMSKGFSPIIIDNTNLVSWEMRVYCEMAQEYGYTIEILEANTPWACDPSILAAKNIHDVPKDKIIRMLNKFDRTITPMSLLNEFKLKQVAPEKRLFPPLFPLLSFNDVNPTRGRGVSTANLDSSTPSSQLLDFLSDKKVEQVIEYVHNFDDKSDKVKTDSPKRDETINDNAAKSDVLEYVHNFDNKKDDKDTSEKPKEEVTVNNNATSPIYPSLSPVVESDQNQNKPSSAEIKSTQKEPETKTNQGEQSDSKTQATDNSNKVQSNTVQNETKQDSASESNKPKTEPQVNLIDLLDDNNMSPSPSTALNLYGAFPLMPISAQPVLQRNQSLQSNQSSKSVENNSFNLQSSSTTETNHLISWGTNEKALQSWETVVNVPSTTKSQIEMDFEIYKKLDEASNRPRTQRSDKTTNTHSDDFRFAQNCGEADGVSVLKTQNRAINGSGFVITKYAPRKKITVDMGCMTEDDDEFKNSRDQVEQQLSDFFPNVPLEYMMEVYDKCNQDLNWTMELLLETPYDPKLNVENKERKKVVEGDDLKENSQIKKVPLVNSWNTLNFNSSNNSSKNSSENSLQNSTQNSSENSLRNTSENSSKKLLKSPSKNDIDEQLKQEKLDLKRKFEENITINKEHYSEFLWGLKSQRQGISQTPSSSKMTPQDSIEEVNNDIDYDYEEEDEETVPITLGIQLVEQLESHLGSEDFINKNLSTKVQMPISLVKQLQALYLESVCQQIEEQNEMVNKDAEYAHKLSNEEREALNGPNLSMIMDEQLAQLCQKKENEQYKTMAPETLAMILKKKKLYEAFPTANKTMIDQLLQSECYDFNDVVDILMSNVDQQYIVARGNLFEDPISDEIVQEMIESKAIAEQVKDDKVYQSAQNYRDDADYYGEKAKQLQGQAQKYHRQGMGQVAVFYSQLSDDLRHKRDVCNQKASYRFLYENSLDCRKDTLDLHYLKVAEALNSLDIYIDKCVARLDKPRDFFVITGQGNHSAGGKSKLKPAVIARLQKRKIKFTMMNPGLLRIKLHKNIVMTNDLKK